MKTLYIDCGMGAAGDMLSAALLELLPDREAFLKRLNALDIPGVVYKAEPSEKCGITGTHMTVTVNGAEEESLDHHENDHHDHHHVHHHEHEGEHSHSHSTLSGIRHIVEDHLDVPQTVKEDILSVYELIAKAESNVHGKTVDEIHFHEVGSMDAIADVTAVCLLMHEIGAKKVVASPVHVGSGKVKCAHGILPVPAPATAFILKDVPIYSGNIMGELCTPTGAALLKHFVTEFGNMPVMSVNSIGYGMGKKDFEVANCVRVFLGESDESETGVYELSANIDDMTGEEIGYACEMLLKAGALDVYTTSIYMKKNRPGVKLSVLCKEQDRKLLAGVMFKHTTTLGVRECKYERYTLDREFSEKETELGKLTVKRSEGYGTINEKYEFDDIRKIADEKGISVLEVSNRTKNNKVR